jgi:glyoxylase-like metal-dependent hydrolase (beta-lactamase superfamily II)
MPLEDEFGDIVKKARLGQGLSVGDVAAKTSLPAGDITVLERGGRTPTLPEVEAMGAALGLRLGPLRAIALEGWTPSPIPATLPFLETVLGDIGGYAVKGYLLHDAGQALMIDTAANPEAMLEAVDRLKVTLIGVALTHAHADHAGGLDMILQHHNVTVYLGGADRSLLDWKPPHALLKAPVDGQTLSVGILTVQVLTTPGHTPGGLCYRFEAGGQRFCSVGDTLFSGSIGRANPFTLYPTHLTSVRHRVLTLPLDTVLLPGHGPATTVREEVQYNPFMLDTQPI